MLPADTIPVNQLSSEQLARLRAARHAAGELANTAQLLAMVAICARCGQDVARDADWDGPFLRITRWKHMIRRIEEDHLVGHVRVPAQIHIG